LAQKKACGQIAASELKERSGDKKWKNVRLFELCPNKKGIIHYFFITLKILEIWFEHYLHGK